MNSQKSNIDYSKVHANHYSLLANIRKAPWVSSDKLVTAIRASIIIYTMFYMVLILIPRPLTPSFNSWIYTLRVPYHMLFPLSTILTSIAGVDMLYIVHLLLLSVNMDYLEVIYNSFSEPGFVQQYSILSIVLAVVNFLLFFYWSIPNRLLFINTFQIGVEVRAQTPYNILKRIGLIWFVGFISIFTFITVIDKYPTEGMSEISLSKLNMCFESEVYLRFAFMLLIEYLMYQQCHPLFKYDLKTLLDCRGASNIAYTGIFMIYFVYFLSIIFLGPITGLGVEWFDKHDETIQLVNLGMQVLYLIRFYFLWHLSIRDFAKESSNYDNTKPDYPQWSWEWKTNPYFTDVV